MIVSHAKRFIFVHVPKTAGSAMTGALGKYAADKGRVPVVGEEFLGWQVDFHDQHGMHHRIMDNIPLVEGNPDYFLFGFVRNPFDRLVSIWNTTKGNKGVPDVDFPEYVDWLIQPERQSTWWTMPQSQWFAGTPRPVDFIGRFELLEDHWKYVLDRLGINGALKPRNVSEHAPYEDYYDAETINKVRGLFLADLRAYDYEFAREKNHV